MLEFTILHYTSLALSGLSIHPPLATLINATTLGTMPEERGIFVRNLPYDTTQAQLEEFFGTVGPVKRVNIITEKCARLAVEPS